jgi:aminoglycoside phosphotransferase (APT) family kinase protein
MNQRHLNQVHAALATIPGLARFDPADFSVTRLGGLTNLVFRIDTPDGAFVLRLPGKGTEDYIDREVELHNAIAAARAGVSAEVIYARPGSGLMLTRCIENITTMTPDAFGSAARVFARPFFQRF